MSFDSSQWGLLHFSKQNEIRLEWDHLRIRLLQRGSDLLLVENRGESPSCVQFNADPESDFRRYAFQSPVKTINVQPSTPDRPLLVQPLHPLRLAPQAKVDFFVSLPIDIRLSTNDENTNTPLERIRSEILSDTWFGNQVSGVLCYAMKSRARRECPNIDSEKTARALCKIQIHNQSQEQLHCTKFCLRLNHCHLWQDGSALWTSPVRVSYNGSDQLSAIDYSEKPPAEAAQASKVAEAITPPLRGLIRRTFAGISTSLS
jgi:hypothetical protein